jgi:hypothetical protein
VTRFPAPSPAAATDVAFSATSGVTTSPGATPSTSAGSASPNPPPTAGSTSPTPAPAATGWESVSNTRGGIAYRRTFHLEGGNVTVWCDPYDVRLLASSPDPGYVLVPTRYDSRSLLISLVSAERTSRVYVTWRGGPYAEVTETSP